MMILLIFIALQLISGVVRCIGVTGYSGGSLLVDSGKLWFRDSAKYMAKVPEWRTIINKKHDKWINEGKFTLFLNDNGKLMIYIRELNMEDAGKYWIMVASQWSIDMTLTVKEDLCCKVSERVTVSVGETATFSCEYSHNHIHDQKIIFKDGKDSIKRIYTWKNERFSVSDNRYKRSFNLKITAVTPHDGGVYLCGVPDRHWISYAIINTVDLHVVSKYEVGVSRVTGYSGGRVMIKCKHPQYKTKPKFICRESDGCSERKSPGVQDQWMENGDVSLYDNTTAGVLMVFFRELKAADAGTYRCGVKDSHYTERFTELQLHVQHDGKYPKSTTESVPPGGEVNITCQIPEEYEGHFCKEDENHICQSISSSKVTQMNPEAERNGERVFSVSISYVSVRDAGVYWCGAETSDTHLTFISLSTKIQINLIAKVGVSRVTGYSEGCLMIKCEHPQYKTKPKFICRESDGCSERNSPAVQDQWMENRDVSLYDNTTAGVLMVFFRELKAADAGTYRCGVKDSHYTERFIELQLHVQHEKPFVTESVPPGGEVNITCQIPEEHEGHFCKEDENHICQSISTSKVTQMNPEAERNGERVFSVSISNVNVRDAGVYWCGAETSDTHLTFISLSTKIQINLIVASVVKHEGESAEIICPYDSVYQSKPKSLCKGKCSSRARNTFNETVREEKESMTDRWTLDEDHTLSVFTGTITGLTGEDAGKYWCAVTLERELNYLYTHLIIILKEELNLTKYEGNDMSIQCRRHHEDQKSFCKAQEPSVCVKDGVSLETIRDDRFSVSDEASAGVFTVNITDLRAEDSGIYWCGAHATTKVNLEVKKSVSSSIISSCVCVSLLLIGASVLSLYALGCLKTRGQRSSTDGTERSTREASHSACDYENIRDVRQRLVAGTDESVLYSTVNHPTDSSDRGQLPTNSSDGILYSTVTFQKRGESLSDAKVVFNNEEIYCDYSTVSHHTGLNRS